MKADHLVVHADRDVGELEPPSVDTSELHGDIDSLRAMARRGRADQPAVGGEELRPGEALRLDRSHVDLDNSALKVLDSKFHDSRELPSHPSTVDALVAYAGVRDELCPHPGDPGFFLAATGTRLRHNTFNTTFVRLLRGAGLDPPPGSTPRPRPHDFRHSFALRTVLGWYRDGLDVEARLPSLSTFLGHLGPATTYWYLSATPELLSLAAQRVYDHDRDPR